jgi:hypothetical protein
MHIDLLPVTDAHVGAQPELQPLIGRTFAIQGPQPARSALHVPIDDRSHTPARVRLPEGANHNNLDINIAPNGWFATDGGFLDQASPDPAVQKQIEDNVAASIDAYEDDDMDGHPDPMG